MISRNNKYGQGEPAKDQGGEANLLCPCYEEIIYNTRKEVYAYADQCFRWMSRLLKIQIKAMNLLISYISK